MAHEQSKSGSQARKTLYSLCSPTDLPNLWCPTFSSASSLPHHLLLPPSFFTIKSHNKQHQKEQINHGGGGGGGGRSLSSSPGSAARFQDDIDRYYRKSPEYQNPTMQRVISTISKNFAEVTKDMSVLLANNLATFVRGELMGMSSSVAAHITLCSAYNNLLPMGWHRRSKRINYPAWFFLASVYGPDHEELRPYRD
ncbi:hypothetical protein Forpe1208_v003809 [Fusarium oxysporum f. sp. rapae]|uniref:Uncharacterized protein n=1 Tax=Fusarium oxysporum f. sp. rapae TaxID=485398 RepID=A0A8J5PEF9_FUSOX|nr:hypothetical protein Forpe1208_v003809 [Fusarium oxysporum f. sp. rapae]